ITGTISAGLAPIVDRVIGIQIDRVLKNNLDILTNTPPPRITTDPPPAKPETISELRAPDLNADLTNAFNKHNDDLIAPYTPENVNRPFDRPETITRLRDDLTDVFTKHFADTIGAHAAKNAADAYTDALTKNWGKNTLNDDLAAALARTDIPPHIRNHLTRTVPDTLTRNLGGYLANPHMRAQILAMAAATGAFEGYIGEGTSNAALTDEGFKAHGYSATAGSFQGGAQTITVDTALTAFAHLKNPPQPPPPPTPPETTTGDGGSGNGNNNPDDNHSSRSAPDGEHNNDDDFSGGSGPEPSIDRRDPVNSDTDIDTPATDVPAPDIDHADPAPARTGGDLPTSPDTAPETDAETASTPGSGVHDAPADQTGVVTGEDGTADKPPAYSPGDDSTPADTPPAYTDDAPPPAYEPTPETTDNPTDNPATTKTPITEADVRNLTDQLINDPHLVHNLHTHFDHHPTDQPTDPPPAPTDLAEKHTTHLQPPPATTEITTDGPTPRNDHNPPDHHLTNHPDNPTDPTDLDTDFHDALNDPGDSTAQAATTPDFAAPTPVSGPIGTGPATNTTANGTPTGSGPTNSTGGTNTSGNNNQSNTRNA
ncbi:hypothetical protein RM446_24575, partial [Streptomonospora sp. DSM 45055]|nr:hypothetical protein [Streptomonospora sp. DSM 45055]